MTKPVETKKIGGFWNEAMSQKHTAQMTAHQAQFGPLGVLHRQATQEELDKAHERFLAEKYGPKTKRTRRSG